MGMYDTLGNCSDNQVKTFYVPCFYASNSESTLLTTKLGYSGGQLRYYGKNEPVPCKTWWYQYPENFIILDIDVFGFYDDLFHIIENGKYIETYECAEDIPEAHVAKAQAFMGKYGVTVGEIKDKDSLLDYIRIYKSSTETWDKYIKENSKANGELIKYIWENKNNRTKADEKKIEEFIRKSKEEEKEQEKMREVIFRTLREKYPTSELIASPYEDFGAYLHCMKKSEESEFFRDVNYQRQLKDEFSKYMEKHGTTLDGYLEWHNPDSKEEEEEIRKCYGLLVSQ